MRYVQTFTLFWCSYAFKCVVAGLRYKLTKVFNVLKKKSFFLRNKNSLILLSYSLTHTVLLSSSYDSKIIIISYVWVIKTFSSSKYKVFFSFIFKFIIRRNLGKNFFYQNHSSRSWLSLHIIRGWSTTSFSHKQNALCVEPVWEIQHERKYTKKLLKWR